jgi:hypothetical protein
MKRVIVAAALLVVGVMPAPSASDEPSRTAYAGPYTPIGTPEYVSRPVESHPVDRRLPLSGAPPSPTVAVGHTPQPTPKGASVSGVPTWFCRAGISPCTSKYQDGPGIDLYAAAGPALRVGDWRGRVVKVCAKTCVHVTLVDFCACAAPHFLDLYYDAWLALGKPHWATVSW